MKANPRNRENFLALRFAGLRGYVVSFNAERMKPHISRAYLVRAVADPSSKTGQSFIVTVAR